MVEEMELNERQLEIKRHIDRLDQFVISLEAIWGIGNLYEYANADLKNKIDRQQEKLHAAMKAQDINLVAYLADGMIRGWQALDAAAKQSGYKPVYPDFMEVKLDSGFTLRIAKNHTEARQCTKEGVYVWSLHEIARVIESEYTLVNKIKDTFPDSQVKNVIEFDFKKGDDLPF